MTLFSAKKYLLKVSVAQASLLLCFDDFDLDCLTIGQLQEFTQLKEADLKSALFHLCKPNIRLLDKAVKKPVFTDPTEEIKLNFKF